MGTRSTSLRAIWDSNMDMARLFIENGADLRASPNSFSPLRDAVEYGHAEMMKSIL